MSSEERGDVPEAHWAANILLAVIIIGAASLIATVWILVTGSR